MRKTAHTFSRRALTVIVGENGSGKSTLLEAAAAYIGFDPAGGGKGYMPVDHSRAIETEADVLAAAFRGAWLPRVAHGWFFRAESFFSVARYLDIAALDAAEPPPDFLSRSHGEAFLRFFGERCRRGRGIFIFDEPEAALSPARQIEFLKILRDMHEGGQSTLRSGLFDLNAACSISKAWSLPYAKNRTHFFAAGSSRRRLSRPTRRC